MLQLNFLTILTNTFSEREPLFPVAPQRSSLPSVAECNRPLQRPPKTAGPEIGSTSLVELQLVAAMLKVVHLAQMRHPGQSLIEAVLNKRLHAKKSCLAADILRGLAIEGHFANRRVH